MRNFLLFLSFFFIFGIRCKSQNWVDLDKGVNWFPRNLYNDTLQNKLYLVGDFWIAGGESAYGIAMWDGSKWDSLGSGMCSQAAQAAAICRFQDTVIVGGGFFSAGCSSIKYLTRWYDNQWHSFGEPNDAVQVLYVYNNELYVGGGFDSIGGIQAHGLAKWNGTSWSTVGNLPDYFTFPDKNVIGRIQFFNGRIYVAGILEDSNQTAVDFASYDGVQWQYHHILNGAFSSGAPPVIYHNELYMIGLFLKTEGNAGNCIMKYNGTTWEDVGGGITSQTLYPQLTDAIVYHDKLYVVGIFDSAGGVPAQNIACWDGTKWCGLGSDIDNKIVTAEIFQDTLYIAGAFKKIDGDSMNYVAKWLDGDYVDTCSTPVGISEINQSNFDFLIYTNPATNEFTVSTSENGLLTITNAFGQVIQSFAIQERQLKIPCAKFPSGNYFLTFQTSKNIQTKKVLIQH